MARTSVYVHERPDGVWLFSLIQTVTHLKSNEFEFDSTYGPMGRIWTHDESNSITSNRICHILTESNSFATTKQSQYQNKQISCFCVYLVNVCVCVCHCVCARPFAHTRAWERERKRKIMCAYMCVCVCTWVRLPRRIRLQQPHPPDSLLDSETSVWISVRWCTIYWFVALNTNEQLLVRRMLCFREHSRDWKDAFCDRCGCNVRATCLQQLGKMYWNVLVVVLCL